MGDTEDVLGPDGSLHQVTRNGSVLKDLSTGRTGFVISDSDNLSVVSDDRGQLHQYLKTGSFITDLTTGETYLEV